MGANITALKCSWLDTKLGSMAAISDDEALYLGMGVV